VLLPLYPQYSTTTTESSAKEWYAEAKKIGLDVPTTLIESYATDEEFVGAHAEMIDQYLQGIQTDHPLRLLFSAHGLPQKVVDDGDPYQRQVEATVKALLTPLAARGHAPDWKISYQSRVGPMKWIGPSTEEEIERAGKEKIGLVVIPIAFVSEHSETLVELDIEYAHLAKELGVPDYFRVPALGTQPEFIKALAGLVQNTF
jgi:ferrochelatase